VSLTTTTPTYGRLLLRGLLAGLIAGLLAGVFAYATGESRIDAAIAIEQAAAAQQTGAVDHHGESVGRGVQRAGLFLATGLYGIAMGGLLATAYALLRRRLRTRSDTDAVLALAGSALLGIVLVPFVKYPANPPAVGDPNTIDARTISWVALVVIGLVAVWAGVVAWRALPPSSPPWLPRAAGTGAFLLVVAVGYAALPSVDDVPATFPADLLWDFRLASLGTQVVLWAALGLAFAALLTRAPRRVAVGG
jgi:hypothetical protein